MCTYSMRAHVCLCLTHLRNRRGPWVQANVKTEQASKKGRERKKERKELYEEGERGGQASKFCQNLKKEG